MDGLRYDAVDSKPVDKDWSEGWPEEWDYREASRCEADHDLAQIVEAAEQLDISLNDIDAADLDPVLVTTERECPACGGELYPEGPMMNYFYPVDLDDIDEAALKLVDVPLCAVRIGEETGLALTGGGMDLSWEICEAFVKLGFYPPAHFAADLPRMGRGKSRSDIELLKACRKSLEYVGLHAGRGIERVDEYLKEAGQ